MRADHLQQEFEIDVTWRPFELHPEIPPEGHDRGERQQRPDGYVSPIRQLAEEAGMPYAPGGHIPNAHGPLEAAEFAREQGMFDAYHRALFQAYFGEGRDIGNLAILTELGEAIGLDASDLEAAVTSGRYTALVNESTEEARGSGITGTPTFIFDDGERRLPIVGAQNYDVLQNVARRMGAPLRTERG